MRASHRTALFHCLLLLLLPVTPCVMLAQQGPPRPGTLELIAADPSRGFYWPYYLVVPDTVKSTTTLVLDPTDAPLAQNQSYRDFTPDATAAQRADYFGFEFFRELGTALVMPVLPHLPSERLPNGDVFWVLHLDPDIFTVSDPSLYRIDLQIVAMIADARARLTTQGIQAAEKVFVDGISSVGIFANRFSILHPQLVQAVAIGAAGIHTMPLAQWQGRNLAYPLGTANLAALAGTAFDARRYRRMPQYVYVGVEDRNENAFLFDPDAAAVARELFGADVPTRFASASAVFASQGNDAVFTTYAGAGHELTAAMMNDIRAFFRAHATRPDEIAGIRKDGVASDALFALGLTRDSGATWLGGARVADTVTIIGTVMPEAAHIGQKADLFVVDRVNLNTWLMRTSDSVFVPWNTRIADLRPIREDVTLTAELDVELFNGTLGISGDHRFFLGYLPADGVLRYTPSALRLDIQP